MNSILISVAIALLGALSARARAVRRAQVARRRIQLRLKAYAGR